jgi:hypothetical protein
MNTAFAQRGVRVVFIVECVHVRRVRDIIALSAPPSLPPRACLKHRREQVVLCHERSRCQVRRFLRGGGASSNVEHAGKDGTAQWLVLC